MTIWLRLGKVSVTMPPGPLGVHIGIRGVVDAITAALDGKQQLFGVVHEFEVGHYNLRMLKAPQILVRTLVLAASAAALAWLRTAGALVPADGARRSCAACHAAPETLDAQRRYRGRSAGACCRSLCSPLKSG